MIRRFLTVLTATVGAFVLLAIPASAHIKIDPSSATQGSYATLTFRVPNEESDADTVGLRVQLPADHPLASVSVQPKNGWQYQVKKSRPSKPLTNHGTSIDSVVSEVDWSGGRIKPGEFDTFSISVGPLPTDADQLVFKTIQEYESADGKKSEVAWIQVAGPGEAEPDHPAPMLQLVPGTDDAHHDTTSAPGQPSVTATTVPTSHDDAAKSDAASTSSVDAALAIAVAGLVLAIIALIVALSRKTRPSDDRADGSTDA